MSWTEDRVEVLKKLWIEGLSASQIAAQLGGVTRNAVIGKVHRLGLSGRVKAPSSASRARKKAPSNTGGGRTTTQPRRSPGGVVMGNVALKDAVATQTQLEIQTAEDVVIPMSRELDLLQLNEKTCKWPSGDPTSDDFSFCGHQTKEGAPYCEFHSKLAYQPSNNGRRKAS